MSAKPLIRLALLAAIALCAACAAMPNRIGPSGFAENSLKIEDKARTPIYRYDCDMPSADENGDGKVTAEDQFIREHYQTLRGEPICKRNDHSSYIQRMLFDFDQANLKSDVIRMLDEAIEIINKHPKMVIEVAGHTDSKGADRYNQRLSFHRARAAYDYLVSNGVKPSQLLGPKGYGENRPIAPNTEADGSDYPLGRAYNRRIELNLQID